MSLLVLARLPLGAGRGVIIGGKSARALAQRLLERHSPVVLAQQVGEGLVGQLLQRLHAVATEKLQLRDADLSLLRDRLGMVMERMALELRGIACAGLVEKSA